MPSVENSVAIPWRHASTCMLSSLLHPPCVCRWWRLRNPNFCRTNLCAETEHESCYSAAFLCGPLTPPRTVPVRRYGALRLHALRRSQRAHAGRWLLLCPHGAAFANSLLLHFGVAMQSSHWRMCLAPTCASWKSTSVLLAALTCAHGSTAPPTTTQGVMKLASCSCRPLKSRACTTREIDPVRASHGDASLLDRFSLRVFSGRL